MRNEEVRKYLGEMQRLGVPFPVRIEFARIYWTYKLRDLVSEDPRFKFLRYEGGCMDPQCNCGASMVYEMSVEVRRRRIRNGERVRTSRIRKYEVKFSESRTHIESFTRVS